MATTPDFNALDDLKIILVNNHTNDHQTATLLEILRHQNIKATVLNMDQVPPNAIVLGGGPSSPLPSTQSLLQSLQSLIRDAPNPDYVFTLPQSVAPTNTPWFQSFDKKPHGRFNKHHAKKHSR